MTWLIHKWHDSFTSHNTLTNESWLMRRTQRLETTCGRGRRQHISRVRAIMLFVSLRYVPWLIYLCDMTHLYVTWLVTWLILNSYDNAVCESQVRAMTNLCVLHDSIICGTWLIDRPLDCRLLITRMVCAMTLWCVWHDSIICGTWLTRKPLDDTLLITRIVDHLFLEFAR